MLLCRVAIFPNSPDSDLVGFHYYAKSMAQNNQRMVFNFVKSSVSFKIFSQAIDPRLISGVFGNPIYSGKPYFGSPPAYWGQEGLAVVNSQGLQPVS